MVDNRSAFGADTDQYSDLKIWKKYFSEIITDNQKRDISRRRYVLS